MKIAKKRLFFSLTALLLMMTIVIPFASLSITYAHDPPWNRPTWCYASVSPNPIGVGQSALVVFWVDLLIPTASGSYGDRYTFTVEVTKPDSSKETLGPFTSDPVGGSYTSYIPDQIGTYTFVAKYPGQKLTGMPTPGGSRPTNVNVNDTLLPSQSTPVNLTVQQEPIQAYQETPLPTEYWNRPINGINREWWQVAGNWLGASMQNNGSTTNFGWGTAPESSHVMWTRPLTIGGVMDARYGDTAYYTGMSYEDFHDFTDIFIMHGKLYYNQGGPIYPKFGWYAVNLYTGETEFFHNTTYPISKTAGFDDAGKLGTGWLSFGQIFDYESPNQHGGYAYLWSTTGATANTWMMFDALTGNYICSIANVSSSGTAFTDKIGSICRISLTTAGGKQFLRIWNTTEAIWWRPQYGAYPPKTLLNGSYAEATSTSNTYWMWRPYMDYTFDGNNGFSMNLTITPSISQTTIRCVRSDEFLIGGSAGSNNEDGIVPGVMWKMSLEPGSEGKLIWNRTFTPPSSAGNKSISMGTVDPENGVFLFECTQTRQRWCYSLESMQLLWESEPEDPWLMYGMDDVIYQGKLFSYGYGGVLTAYDISTGDIAWKYYAGTTGFETPYSGAQLSLGCVADGKLYFYSTEHSPTTPLWRGQFVRCVNASNGAELWRIHNWASRCFAVSDGYLVTLNQYDMQLYCYGKGPTATTVEAPMTAITEGSSVVIQGSVTDTAGGTKQAEIAARFPNGVAAVSDESITDWMEYVYMQRPRPTNSTGVLVTIDVTDENGNYRNIGTATTDEDGFYSFRWTPDITGKYTIVATFQGSKSYWPSHAETAFAVDEAIPTPTQQPIAALPPTEMYIVGGVVAIIIAISVGFAITILTLRKRP